MSKVFREQKASVASIDHYDATRDSYLAQITKSQTVKYVFSVNAGAQGNINIPLKYPIPSGSIVLRTISYATTTYAGANSTIRLGLNAANDLNAAAITVAQINAGWQESRESAVAPVVATAERSNLIFTIGGADATAGVVRITIEYLLPFDT